MPENHLSVKIDPIRYQRRKKEVVAAKEKTTLEGVGKKTPAVRTYCAVETDDIEFFLFIVYNCCWDKKTAGLYDICLYRATKVLKFQYHC